MPKRRDANSTRPRIPSAVVRSAVALAIPFALVWMIAGQLGWAAFLDEYGTTWPASIKSSEVALVLLVFQGLSGVVVAVVLRLAAWFISERRRRRQPVRVPPVHPLVKTPQNWQSDDYIPLER